ncbi:MAG: DNA polymerase III subunit alpha [Eubacteriales bacterium]
MSEFVHLHLHSEYSLLDGACHVEDIPRAAKAAGHTAAAITDHGVMYGAVEFYKACIAEGIKPIIGCEVYVAPRSRFDRSHELDSEKNHLVLLCKDEIGYKNLIYMVSKSFTEGFYSKPGVDLELLAAHSEGLICLSACLAGYIPRAILADNTKEARAYAEKLRDIFGADNFYLELQNHGLDEDMKVINGICRIAKETGIPLVATNDVHYIKRSDADTQAVLMCIQTNNVITDGRPIGFKTDEFYYKSTDEMRELFGQYDGAIENTVKIADRCKYDFNFKTRYIPSFIPPDGKKPDAYVKELALAGLTDRVEKGEIVYDEKFVYDDYRKRIDYELVVITSLKYSEYFLIVWDFVHYAKSHGIPTGPGRGSGAGSLIAYLLRITDVDPLRYKLLFETFLNPERVSMPDFDIDFCYDRRDEVIKYVTEKYGDDHVSQIVTFGTLAARAAIRDVGRALGMSYADTDAVARQIPQKLGITLAEAMRGQELKRMYDASPQVKRLIDTAGALEGMPRHTSTHAAGVVITDQPIYTYVPLSKNDGCTVTQYDMDTIASLGLLKFDFLALRYLTIISDTEKMIRESSPGFKIEKIPLDDASTYAMISQGTTDGMFQLESGGMRQMLTAFRPASIEDIMIAIALYRPGPMDSIPKFLENRRNKDKIKYKSDVLKEVLEETCGCIVYQEQVMQIFRFVAKYTYGKADIVRRAIAKKKQGVIESERETFIKGAVDNGLEEKDAAELFADMIDFSNYGFKKSHAAAYALISYRTAYLKCHYPAMYMSALLTSVLGSAGKVAQYTAECARVKINILPPDINESRLNFTVSGGGIRFGLVFIKNVGAGFIKKAIEQREKGGKYRSFIDFIERTEPAELNKRQIEALISAGVFDSLGVYRSRLLLAYEKIIDIYSERGRSNIDGQLDMFADSDGHSGVEASFQYPDVPELTLREKLNMEKEAAGQYFSGHILDDYSRDISARSPARTADIKASFDEESTAEYKEGDSVKICGSVSKRVNKTTKSGDAMAFVTIEDRTGEIECVIFPKVLEKFRALLTYDRAVCVAGEISVREDEPPKLLCKSIEPLVTDSSYTEAAPVQSEVSGQRDITPDASVEVMQNRNYAPGCNQNIPSQYIRGADAAGKRLFLKVDGLDTPMFKRVYALLVIFEGITPVVIYNSATGKYLKANGVNVNADAFLMRELMLLLGRDAVVLR